MTATQPPTDPRQLASAVAIAMWQRDRAAQALGMALVEVRPGYAKLTMPVRADMLNGHRIGHGGLIFTLADSAFAYACNSYNQNTVASACHIDFLVPARLGELLQAEAIEQSRVGRSGVYDVTVRAADGKTIALLRGKCVRIQGEVIAALEHAAAEGASV